MRTISKISIAVFLLVLPFVVMAHQPKMVEDKNTIQVENPENSQAFYSILDSGPQIYEIKSDTPFVLYINFLAPKIKNATTTKDFSAFIYQRGEYGPNLLDTLIGPKFQWTEFHEPFANDDYFKGPEFKQEVNAGKYFIKIVSSCHSDFGPTSQDCGPEKYILVVGEKEKFSFGDIIETLRVLPQEKKFFNKSVFNVLAGLLGLYFLLAVVIIIVIGTGIWLAIRFFRNRRRQIPPANF
jgi:hypothetical protein